MKPEIKEIHQKVEGIVGKLNSTKTVLDAMVGDLHLIHMKASRFRNGKLPPELAAINTALKELQDNAQRLELAIQGQKTLTKNLLVESQGIPDETPASGARVHHLER